MSSHRFLFYVPGVKEGDGRLIIDGDEHYHLSRVLRVKPGQTVFATNGAGLIVAVAVDEVEPGRTSGSVQDVVAPSVTRRRVTLALALIAKPRFEQAFEQCVELGITECIPFVSSKSQVKSYGRGFLDRLGRIGLSAMKQSFRATLPAVAAPVGIEDLIGRFRPGLRVIVGDAQAPPIRRFGDEDDTMVIVGPEAGFSEGELDMLINAGATPASTSPFRLRSETAAVTLVAAAAGSD